MFFKTNITLKTLSIVEVNINVEKGSLRNKQICFLKRISFPSVQYSLMYLLTWIRHPHTKRYNTFKSYKRLLAVETVRIHFHK